MALISKNEVIPHFGQKATNSSHFVWLLGDFQFYETTQRLIFSFKRRKTLIFLALEPLGFAGDAIIFEEAWEEFKAAIPHEIAIWVSVYEPFAKFLHAEGYQALCVGKEPWIHLDEPLAKGKTARGVRSAKNQAIHSGAKIIEWSSYEIERDPAKRQIIQNIWVEWRSKRPILLSGFLNATDPFAHVEFRRFFMAIGPKGEVQGYLIATHIPGIESYFFEDLMLLSTAFRGTGELLTLHAAEVLGEEGIRKASLGVVSMTALDEERSYGLSATTRSVILGIPKILKKLYNVDGLETFRKRFKPKEWGLIFLALKRSDGKEAGLGDWLRVIFNLFMVFDPKWQLNFHFLRRMIHRVWEKNPLSTFFAVVSLFIFWRVNHWGDLPNTVLNRYGFSASSPIPEWFYRTITSDWLYFSASHFWSCFIAMMFLLRWTERTHKKFFVFSLFFLISFFDDFIDFYAIEKPFHFFQPATFHRMALEKDVGSSLIIAALVGLQLCQIRKNRELYFIAIALFVVLGIAYSSEHMTALVLNLNHFIFLSIGYAVGKTEFEYFRRKNSAASKRRSP